MQVILHTGAHGTDNDRLLRCLLRNAQALSDRGVAVPGPGKYRDLLNQSFDASDGVPPSPDSRDVLMDAILDTATADRMILSNAYFFGPLRFAIQDGVIYPDAQQRLAHLQYLFQGDRLNMFMALRNPAIFLSEALQKAGPNRKNAVLGGRNPHAVRWSECLARIRRAIPDVDLTIWCNEDTPVIWGQVVRDLAGLPSGEKITGAFDLLSEIMTGEGMQRFRSYLHKHPRLSENQKRKVIMAFLDKYAIEEKLEEELDAPGWTDELVDELTENYDADVSLIRQMPGVTFISP